MLYLRTDKKNVAANRRWMHERTVCTEGANCKNENTKEPVLDLCDLNSG